MSNPFSRTRCTFCDFDGAPHDVLVNLADDSDGDPVFACDDQRACAERMSERADLVPYVLPRDLDDGGDAR